MFVRFLVHLWKKLVHISETWACLSCDRSAAMPTNHPLFWAMFFREATKSKVWLFCPRVSVQNLQKTLPFRVKRLKIMILWSKGDICFGYVNDCLCQKKTQAQSSGTGHEYYLISYPQGDGVGFDPPNFYHCALVGTLF